MSEPLQIGVLGVTDTGDRVIDAVVQSPQAALAAVADRDADIAARRGRALGVESFDDFRAFVLGGRLDALLVAAPPFACTEALRLAAGQHIPVWRTPPLARNFSEAVQLSRLFNESGTPLVVGRTWERQATRDRLAELGDLFLGHAQVICSETGDLDWRGDQERAGGGVLIDAGYDVVDLLVTRMGIPDGVSAGTALTPSSSESHRRHDTEDTAIVLMQYGGGVLASIMLCRTAAPSVWQVMFHGEHGSVSLDRSRMIRWSRDGREQRRTTWEQENVWSAGIEQFLREVSEKMSKYSSPAAEHLGVVAVIEAAYLSARTGEPESPTRLFELQGIDMPVTPNDG